MLDQCYSLIYGQLQPYPYVACLFGIVDEQSNIRYAVGNRGKISDEDIESFLEAGKPFLEKEQKSQNVKESFDGKSITSDLANWSSLLKNIWYIAPGYARYLKYLIEIWRENKKLSSPQTSPKLEQTSLQRAKETTDKTSQKSDKDLDTRVTDEKMYDCLMKFSHVLNIFLCGGYLGFEQSDQSEKNTEDSNKRFRRPYKFGYNSIVQNWQTLGKFVTSFPIRKKFSPVWEKEVSESFMTGDPKLDNDEDIKKILASLQGVAEPGSPTRAGDKEKLEKAFGSEKFTRVINSVVDFACAGEPMTLPNYVVKTKAYGGTERNLKDMARDWIASSICGWCPGDRNAYSLVLLGGTGSGKSSIAQSGLIALSESLSQFGYSVSYPGPVDGVIVDFYNDEHYEKRTMPDATEEGARYTLTLALQKIKDPGSRVNLIFTDIAGEKIESALLGGAEDPVVLGALRSANTFVYLFDFIAWSSFAAALNSEELKGNWQDFLNQKENLRKKSRAVRDSFEMLKAVVDKIYQIRKQENTKDPYSNAKESNFILVFPKADLYWKDNRFFSKFAKQLEKSGILQKSLSCRKELFVSRGRGAYSETEETEETEETILELATLISENTVIAIQEEFKNTFVVSDSEGNSNYIESYALSSVLESGVIEFLKERFTGGVYFLPVSAQGDHKPKAKPEKADSDNTSDESKDGNASDESKDGNAGDSYDFPPAQTFCEFVFLIAAELAMESINTERKP